MTCVSCGALVSAGMACPQCGTPAPQHAPPGPPPIPGMQAPPAAPPPPGAGAGSPYAPGGYGEPAPGAYGYGTPHTAYGMFNTPQIPTPAGLTPAEAVKRVLTNYATFRGRASRSEYWWWALIQFLAIFVPILVVILISARAGVDPGETAWSGIVGVWVMIVVLGTVVPTIATTVRRLHDIGQSGWIYLIIFIPSIGGIALLVICALASQPVGNQYGLAPTGTKPPFQLQP